MSLRIEFSVERKERYLKKHIAALSLHLLNKITWVDLGDSTAGTAAELTDARLLGWTPPGTGANLQKHRVDRGTQSHQLLQVNAWWALSWRPNSNS